MVQVEKGGTLSPILSPKLVVSPKAAQLQDEKSSLVSNFFTSAKCGSIAGLEDCLRVNEMVAIPVKELKDEDDFTPLHFAAMNGHTECVDLLVKVSLSY